MNTYIIPSTKLTALGHGHNLECYTPQCTRAQTSTSYCTISRFLVFLAMQGPRNSKLFLFSAQSVESSEARKNFQHPYMGCCLGPQGGTLSLAVHPLFRFSLLLKFSGTPALQGLFGLSEKFCSEIPLKVCFEENSIHFATFLGILLSESLFILRIKAGWKFELMNQNSPPELKASCICITI